MRVELMDVTPAIAEGFLLQNEHNRPINPKRVRSLTAAMKSGEWQLNGETVIIGEDGSLLDGQHRLKAVTEFGRSVPMLVAFGASSDAFKTIDTGAARTAGNILQLAGVQAPGISSAVARLIWQMHHHLPLFVKVPPSYLIKIVDRYPSIQKWAARCGGKGVSTILPASTLAAACVYLEDVARLPNRAEEFFIGVTEGAGLAETSPILALRNRIVNMRAHGARLDALKVWPVTAKAIGYFETGQKVTKIRAPAQSGAVDTPETYEYHLQRLTPAERLADLLPPERAMVA